MPQPAPALYQPRLGWWSHVWRHAVALGIGVTLWMTMAEGQTVVEGLWEDYRPLLWLDIALGLLAHVLMQWRRRWPLPIAVVVTLFGLVSVLSLGASTVVAASVATRRRWPEVVTVGVLSMVVGQLFVVVYPVVEEESQWVTFGTNITFTVALLAVGMYIGSRRELLWTLRDRAERAEAEQGLRVAQARSTERARIAREMHDTLAHRISLVTMHAGALAYRDDLSPAEVKESAGIISAKAHEALADLREVLGVMRREVPEPQDRPQPTLANIADLVQEAVDSGMNAEYDARVEAADTLAEQVGRTAYRIVQEGLTNARKHAPGTLVKVTVAGSPQTGLGVRVVNRNPIGEVPETQGAGLGLVGLAERAELAGGHIEHRQDDTSFELHGRLPWQG
ncbi:MAG TPA: histidine kinase [Nocardioidaceae bacterium]|nr:histidine kinase [Nocardioidaceae bacterium]